MFRRSRPRTRRRLRCSRAVADRASNAARLDELVLLGQVASALPLIQRLRERGLVVVVAGPPATPLDIRGACSKFIDLRSLHSYDPHSRPGRHRA